MSRVRHFHGNVQNMVLKDYYKNYVYLLRSVKCVSPKSGPVILSNLRHSNHCKDYSLEQWLPKQFAGIRGYISVMAD